MTQDIVTVKNEKKKKKKKERKKEKEGIRDGKEQKEID